MTCKKKDSSTLLLADSVEIFDTMLEPFVFSDTTNVLSPFLFYYKKKYFYEKNKVLNKMSLEKVGIKDFCPKIYF